MITLQGKCSYFGGPQDSGVGPQEGLALVEMIDMTQWRFRHLFLSATQWDNGKALARNLNPNAFYCAMIWSKLGLSRDEARNAMVRVKNGAGQHAWAQPCDVGPGDGSVIDGDPTRDTGRIVDLSPGLMKALALNTDDEVTVEIFGGAPAQ